MYSLYFIPLLFQFNCCAIKGVMAGKGVDKRFPFQFNCCAIKGVSALIFLPASWYFNSTVVRLKAIRHVSTGMTLIISIQLLCD